MVYLITIPLCVLLLYQNSIEMNQWHSENEEIGLSFLVFHQSQLLSIQNVVN